MAAVMYLDGSSVLAGYTWGNWSWSYDFAVVKLDANGSVLWEWQVRMLDKDLTAQ